MSLAELIRDRYPLVPEMEYRPTDHEFCIVEEIENFMLGKADAIPRLNLSSFCSQYLTFARFRSESRLDIDFLWDRHWIALRNSRENPLELRVIRPLVTLLAEKGFRFEKFTNHSYETGETFVEFSRLK